MNKTSILVKNGSKSMIDEPQNGTGSDNKEASIPSPRPVYSTKDYANKRNSPPPPPPAQNSAVRDRVRKRRMSKRAKSAGEGVWVLVTAAI